MRGDSGRVNAILAVTVGGTLIGLSPIAVRLSELGPQATNFWRFAFALPILAVLAAAGPLSRPSPSRGQVGLLLAAGLLFGFEIALWGAALWLTTVTNATLLSNMTPIFAAGFGWLLFKERLSKPILAGGLVALAGAVVLAVARAQDAPQHAAGASGWIGDALGFSAAVGYAAYLLIVRGLGGRVGVGAVMYWATAGAAVFQLATTQAMGEALFPHTAQGWALLMALAIVVQVIGQGLIAWGVARLPIAMSTVLLWMQPLSAAVLAWMLFGEALGPFALAGAALILAGVFVVQRSRATPGTSPAAGTPPTSP